MSKGSAFRFKNCFCVSENFPPFLLCNSHVQRVCLPFQKLFLCIRKFPAFSSLQFPCPKGLPSVSKTVFVYQKISRLFFFAIPMSKGSAFRFKNCFCVSENFPPFPPFFPFLRRLHPCHSFQSLGDNILRNVLHMVLLLHCVQGLIVSQQLLVPGIVLEVSFQVLRA